MSARRFMIVALVLVTLLAVGCAQQAAAPTATPAEQMGEEEPAGPIKVGFLAPTSSVAAESAQDMIDGWSLFWEQNGTEVAGREVQTLIEDDTGDPDVALSKTRALVEQENVDMVVGLLFANTGLAIADYVTENEVPTFFQIVSADDLTQRDRSPYIVRVAGWTSSQIHHPFGEYLAVEEGCTNVYTIGSDYAFGHEVVGGLVNTFTDNGGEVVDQVWNPIGETDFSSYLASIQSANPDCVFSLEVGASAVRFIQTWNNFGLRDSDMRLYLGEVPGDTSILRGVEPPEAAIGLISAGHYADGRDSPATRDFVNAYDQKYGKIPSYYATASYVAAQWLNRAMEEVNGNVEDAEAFLNAVRNVEFSDTPFGPLRLDEYDNPIQNIYIREVVQREDGRLSDRVIKTYPSVSQFWHYVPEQYLEQPVYSRDYQGADWPTSCDAYESDCPLESQ